MTNQNTNPDYYKDELYLDEDFRMLAKTYPADVSAIGVTALIDYVEALESELAALREQVRWRKYPEEMPKSDDRYLVISEGRTSTRYFEDGKFIEYILPCYNVTHWMPLPQPREAE